MLALLALHVSPVAVLALIVGFACRWGRPRPALCHALWLVVMVKLLFPPVLAWPLTFQEMLPNASRAFMTFTPADGSMPATPGPTTTAKQVTPGSASSIPPVASISIWEYAPLGLAALWIIGGITTLAIHLSRIRRFTSMVGKAAPAPDWLQKYANCLAGRFGVRPPKVMVAPEITSAMVWNPWRPKVLVSKALLNTIAHDEWNCIIAHELAHLKRRDLWVGCLELAVACLWWWNPLLATVRRHIHLYAELACDAWVLWALPENGRQYAGVLLRAVSCDHQQSSPVPAFGMPSGNAAALKARLAMLLDGCAACRLSKKSVAAILLLLLVATPSLTLGVEAARRNVEPIVYKPSDEAETTRDAKAVIETRLYIVKGKMDKQPLPDCPNSGYPTLIANGIYTKIESKQVTAGGVPVTMDGNSLLWNGKDQPESKRVAQVACPVFAVCDNDAVSVRTVVTAQALQWLNADTPLELKFSFFAGSKEPKLWPTLAPPDNNMEDQDNAIFVSRTPWIHVAVQTPTDQWNGLSATMGGNHKESVTLLIFWKKSPCSPSDPVRKLPGPARGEFYIKHHEWKIREGDPNLKFTAEITVLEANSKDIKDLVIGLNEISSAAASPAGLRVFELADKEMLKNAIEKLEQAPEATLRWAPRVTFQADRMPVPYPAQDKRNQPKGNDLFERQLADFSQSLEDFFNLNTPRVVIMDFGSEMFPQKDKKNVTTIYFGTAAAIASSNEVRDNALDINS